MQIDDYLRGYCPSCAHAQRHLPAGPFFLVTLFWVSRRVHGKRKSKGHVASKMSFGQNDHDKR